MIYGKDILDNCVLSNKDNFEAAKVVDYLNAESYFTAKKTEGLKKGIPGTMVGNFSDGDERTYLFGPYSHTVIIGGTGTGKTEGYFLPVIDAYAESKQKNSLFIMDLKGLTYAKTAAKLRQNGYKIYVLNFKDPFSSMRFNPLSGIYRSYRKAQELKKKIETPSCFFKKIRYPSVGMRNAAVMREANILMAHCENELMKVTEILAPVESKKDPTWDYGSRDIISSALYGMLEDSDNAETGMTEEKYNFFNLFNLLYTTERDNYYIINWIINHSDNSRCRRMLSYYDMKALQTRDCYINNTFNKLNRYNNLPTHVLTAVSDVDPYRIAVDSDNHKIAVYCLTDESYSITYALCLMFINQLLSALQMHRDKTGCVNSPFLFLLDEFANMPKLPAVEKWISTLRSRNIWLHLGLQSYAQLNACYGDNAARIILDNCDTQIFFGSNNRDTVNIFCNSLGKTCKAVCSLNLENNGRISSSIQPQNLPLVRQSDLDELKQGYAYVKCFRKPVLFTKTDLFFTYCPAPSTPENETILPEKEYDFEKLRYDIRNMYFDERKGLQSFLKSCDRNPPPDSPGKKYAKAEIFKTDSVDSAPKTENFSEKKKGKAVSSDHKPSGKNGKKSLGNEENADKSFSRENAIQRLVDTLASIGSQKKEERAKRPHPSAARVYLPAHYHILGFFLEYSASDRNEIDNPAEKMNEILENHPDFFAAIKAEYDCSNGGILGLFEFYPMTEIARSLVKQGVLSENGHYMEIISVLDDEILMKKLLIFLKERTDDDNELIISIEANRPYIAEFLYDNDFIEFEYNGAVPSDNLFFYKKSF